MHSDHYRDTSEFFRLCSGIPTIGVAKELHSRFRSGLTSKLERLILIIEDATKVSLKALRERLNAVNRFLPINPDLYAAQWRLSAALSSKETNAIVDSVGCLERILSNPNTNQRQAVSTINNSLCDQVVMEFLVGPEGARGPGGEVPEMYPLTDADLQPLAQRVLEAIDIINKCDPAIGDEIAEYVSEIRLFRGKVVRGITSVRAFGIVYLREPDAGMSSEQQLVYFVDHLTHEVSHLHLHCIMYQDPLILNEDDQRFKAPIRLDLRPLFGIYHATFVLSRIVRVMSQWAQQGLNDYVSSECVEAMGRYSSGYRTVLEHGRLTPLGQTILANTQITANCVDLASK